jgi:2-polyprenyl-3-methyl-5-hydroxy-6-metoxy-1,4-benzoquinol methylase
MDFYRELVTPIHALDTLEIACGTGRVALRLAQAGANVTGLDLSTELLDIAQRNSIGLSNAR